MEHVSVNFNNKIDEFKIQLSDLSKQKLIEKFFGNNGRAIYVCIGDEFIGVITLGKFLDNMDNEEQWMNSNCFFVHEGQEQEAQEIISNKVNINQIPILDAQKRIIGEVERYTHILKKMDTKKKESIVEYFNLLGKHVIFAEEITDFTQRADVYIVLSENRKKIAEKISTSMIEKGETAFEKADAFLHLYEIAVKMKERDIPFLYFARPGIKKGYLYNEQAVKRMEEKTTFNKIVQDYDKYQEIFKLLYGEDVSREFIGKINSIPPIVRVGERTYHLDENSPFVNVISGKRVTKEQPDEVLGNIYIYGRCGVFGYAVIDSETIPSVLQKKVNEAGDKFCVVNNGLWGANIQSILSNLELDLETINNSDIVILYMQPLTWEEQQRLLDAGMKYYDCTEVFHKDNKVANSFFDRPGHMSAKGYEVIATYIYVTLSENGLFELDKRVTESNNCIQPIFPKNSQIEEYTEAIKKKYEIDYVNSNIGAIVMNCNPCTNGHLFLIEYAARMVDYLFIFVVEEDKSKFPFKERLELVKKACKHLKNVFVVGSGKFIISTLTFPDYFEKETQKEMVINPIKDIEIFGQYIARNLNIKTRFAGEEPIDLVTQQYNIMMKRELPRYGIRFVEIPRKEIEGMVVSASTVRRLSAEGRWKEVEKLVPNTTYNFLIDWFH